MSSFFFVASSFFLISRSKKRMSNQNGEKTETEDVTNNWKDNKLYKFERDMVVGAVMGGMVHTVVAPKGEVPALDPGRECGAGETEVQGFCGLYRTDREGRRVYLAMEGKWDWCHEEWLRWFKYSFVVFISKGKISGQGI